MEMQTETSVMQFHIEVHIFCHPQVLLSPPTTTPRVLFGIHVFMNLNKTESIIFKKTYFYEDYLPLSPIFVPNDILARSWSSFQLSL